MTNAEADDDSDEDPSHRLLGPIQAIHMQVSTQSLPSSCQAWPQQILQGCVSCCMTSLIELPSGGFVNFWYDMHVL